ncbi:hypothetical protein [Leptolyngbya sp. NIES-2104]|uniref:hypothetical protein n=1 Tax=Leptolyngbya sp. NIES-2104 TaxID=1552121 RepID=UPI0006ECC447|nr:hypothetical protein [Leptolyngbya sp. NIES-2104]GAP97449.1 hypothetical protein NIES2104_39960 [Leptolyngbya sp. NIES-2104]
MKSTLLACLVLTIATPAMALPPPEDQPEEVARTEIITEARSPIDNKPLNAAEYVALQKQLQQGQPENPRDQVSPQLRRTIGLLRLRRFIKTVFPFIPLR